MKLLIADTRKDVGRGHQSRIQALRHALGGHIVEMDDSVPCGIRLDGELICEGLEYALIRPKVVALRPDEWPADKWERLDMAAPALGRAGIPLGPGEFVRYPEDVGEDWLERLDAATCLVTPCGVAALEACCLGTPIETWPTEDNRAQYDAINALSHAERFEVIDGKGADRVAEAIRTALENHPQRTNPDQPDT